MRTPLVAAVAFAILLAAFAVDAFTPQTLVVAILLDVPIVLAALTRSRRLTASLVSCALVADVAAAFIDAGREGHWDPIGVGDRALTLLSIALVGFLSTAVQERAERVGRLAAGELRARREKNLADAAEAIRESLSPELVTRAVVRQAPALFGLTGARWYAADGGDAIVSSTNRAPELLDEPVPPEIASTLQRVLDGGRVLVAAGGDPVARLLLDRLRARTLVAIPVQDRTATYGAVLVYGDELQSEDEAGPLGRAFADIAATALAQARLFAQLAERNDALGERQEVIRDLVYALSHDLRTPLFALALTLRQARDGVFGALPDTYRDVIAASLISIDDLARLAETLLLVARFEAGERRPHPEPVPLAPLAREVAAEFEAFARDRDVALQVADAGGEVIADRGDLRRALANLVANSLQHTKAGGSIMIATEKAGARARLRVDDDGFGIPPGARDRLFRRFSANGDGGGTGLGLYIVRRIAEESGGTVRYDAREGSGSSFTLDLPAVPG